MRVLAPALLLPALLAAPLAAADPATCDADPSIFLRPPTFGLNVECSAAGEEVLVVDIDHFFTCHVTVLGHTVVCYDR